DEDVEVTVGVPSYQVRRAAPEGHEASVGRDGVKETGEVAPRAVGRDAHALRRARHPVVDEDVYGAVGVPGHQVCGIAVESDEAAVGRKGRANVAKTAAIALRAVGCDA